MILLRGLKKAGNNFTLSRYFRCIKKGNKVAIFHELQPFPIFTNLKEWSHLVKKKEISLKIFKKLKKSKLVLNSPKEDDLFFEKIKSNFDRKLNKTFILYLVLTKDCNYSCSYCPFRNKGVANNETYSLMSKKVLISGINLWRKHILENLKNKDNYFRNYFIIFYGGEPLLNFKTIKDGLLYIDKLKKKKGLPKNLKLLLPTNGFLINDEMIKFFKKYNFMVTIGLDGINTNQNIYRKDGENLSSFEKSINIIKKLIKNKINASVSITITPSNINKIYEFPKFFKKIGVRKIGFNFLKGDALLRLVGKSDLGDYYRKASDGVIKGFLENKNPNYEFQMEKKYNSFLKKDFFPVDCTCYGNQLVIMPDGTITNCPFNGKKLDNVKKSNKNFRIWNIKEVKKIQKRFPLFQKNEEKFYWKSLYGGGCAWNSEEIYGDKNAIDEGANIFAKEVFDLFLWHRSKNLF